MSGYFKYVGLVMLLFTVLETEGSLPDGRRLQRRQSRDKDDLLKELEELLNRHMNKTENDPVSINLEKLRFVKDMMEELSILMEDIYAEAAASVTESTTTTTTTTTTVMPTPRQPQYVFSSCYEAYQAGYLHSGVYGIKLSPISAVSNIYCNMQTAGGGWTVFQRRFNGSVDFYRNWNDYKIGFGDPNGEYWLGLDALHQLTKNGDQEMYILLEEFDGRKTYARYSTFSVAPEEDAYKLNVAGYTGSAGDGMSYHKGMGFSTKDRDNDESDRSCAVERKGAWWYMRCMMSNLNGKYRTSAKASHQYGFSWYRLQGSYQYFLKASMMMVRPKTAS